MKNLFEIVCIVVFLCTVLGSEVANVETKESNSKVAPIFASEQINDEDITVHVLSPKSIIHSDKENSIPSNFSGELTLPNDSSYIVATENTSAVNNGMIAFDLMISNNDADLFVTIYNDQREILCQTELQKNVKDVTEARSILCFFTPELLYEGDNYLFIEISNVHTNEIVFHTVSHFFYYDPAESNELPPIPVKQTNAIAASPSNSSLISRIGSFWDQHHDSITWSSALLFAGVVLQQLWELQRDEQTVIPYAHPLYPYLPVILRDKQEVGFPVQYYNTIHYSLDASMEDITSTSNAALPPTATSFAPTIQYTTQTNTNMNINTNMNTNTEITQPGVLKEEPPPIPPISIPQPSSSSSSSLLAELQNITRKEEKKDEGEEIEQTTAPADDDDDDDDHSSGGKPSKKGSSKGLLFRPRVSFLPKIHFPSLPSLSSLFTTARSRGSVQDITITTTTTTTASPSVSNTQQPTVVSRKKLSRGWWWWQGMIGLGILLLTSRPLTVTPTSFLATSDILWKDTIMPWKQIIGESVHHLTQQVGSHLAVVQSKLQASLNKKESRGASLLYHPSATKNGAAAGLNKNNLYQVPPILVHDTRPRRSRLRPFIGKVRQQFQTIFPPKTTSKHIPLPSTPSSIPASSGKTPSTAAAGTLDATSQKTIEERSSEQWIRKPREIKYLWKAMILAVFFAVKVMNHQDNATQILQHIGIFENTYLPFE